MAHTPIANIRCNRPIVEVDRTYPWLVYELASSFDRWATPSLVFESEGAVRRVRNYPLDWRQLSDGELFSPSWRR